MHGFERLRIFHDRADAGRALASRLGEYARRPDAIVLGLPRGGVPVAREIASALALPLDVLVVRKLGAPGQPELAVGAIAAGVVVRNPEVMRGFASDSRMIDAIAGRERVELERRERLYRAGSPPLAVAGKTVLLVDDGAATGASMRAAIAALRARHAALIVVALPTASAEACETLQRAADRVVCLQTPTSFNAVGEWYERFDQTTDREVIDLLQVGRTTPTATH
ncbi:MAG: phosphoribosyltransferase [Gammaproteobacteria bacterium]|nr:phosphoribosyltransferase [Gammaproteobacteria bacterium]